MYRFSRVSPLSRTPGAAHGAEVPYVFGLTSDASQFVDADRTLSDAMTRAWAQFARAGNPNGGALREWPLYRSPGFRVMAFGDEITVGSNANDQTVAFF